jgi:hypothetical protein
MWLSSLPVLLHGTYYRDHVIVQFIYNRIRKFDAIIRSDIAFIHFQYQFQQKQRIFGEFRMERYTKTIISSWVC